MVPGLPCRDHGGAGASLRPGRPLDAGRGAGTAALGGAEVGGRAEAEAGPVIELKNAKLHPPPPRMYEKNR